MGLSRGYKFSPGNQWGFPKMLGFPNNHGLNPIKNDQHLGCEMGVPPFKETPKMELWDPTALTCSPPKKDLKGVLKYPSPFRDHCFFFSWSKVPRNKKPPGVSKTSWWLNL